MVITIVAAVIGGLLALGKACLNAEYQAHIQAIREGRVSLESEKDFLWPQDYDSLKAELEKTALTFWSKLQPAVWRTENDRRQGETPLVQVQPAEAAIGNCIRGGDFCGGGVRIGELNGGSLMCSISTMLPLLSSTLD